MNINTERLEAHFENRIYYFQLVSKAENEIKITMYNTPYTFVKKDDVWMNSSLNAMNMNKDLIAVVVNTVSGEA